MRSRFPYPAAEFLRLCAFAFRFENAALQGARTRRIAAALLTGSGGGSEATLSFSSFGQFDEAEQRELPVTALRTRILHCDAELRGPVAQGHGRRDFVDVLSAWAGRARESLLEITLAETKRSQAAAERVIHPR